MLATVPKKKRNRVKPRNQDLPKLASLKDCNQVNPIAFIGSSMVDGGSTGEVHTLRKFVFEPRAVELPKTITIDLSVASDIYYNRKPTGPEGEGVYYSHEEHLVRSTVGVHTYLEWCDSLHITPGEIDDFLTFEEQLLVTCFILYNLNPFKYLPAPVGQMTLGDTCFKHRERGMQEIHTTIIFTGNVRYPWDADVYEPCFFTATVTKASSSTTTCLFPDSSDDDVEEELQSSPSVVDIEQSVAMNTVALIPSSTIILRDGTYFDHYSCTPSVTRPLSTSINCRHLLDGRLIMFFDPDYVYVHDKKCVTLPAL